MDLGPQASFSDWLSQFGRYAVGSSPWPAVTVLIFLWVSRFSASGYSTTRYIATTTVATAVMTGVYVWVASALYAINNDIPVNRFTESLYAVPAFSWFWDATLLIVNLGLAHAWTYQKQYESETERAKEYATNNERLEAELTRLELDLLRAQLEPHFLFNALNSITALIRSSKPDEATDALISLSELLRYAIESGKSNSVSVRREVSVATEYLRLQKLRFGDRLEATFSVSPQSQDRTIPPMMMQPLLENAVQHGMGDLQQPARISVTIDNDDSLLQIVIKNSVSPGHRKSDKGGFGLGLTNIRRRLECLYPKSHTFSTKLEDDTFTCAITMSHDDPGGRLD